MECWSNKTSDCWTLVTDDVLLQQFPGKENDKSVTKIVIVWSPIPDDKHCAVCCLMPGTMNVTASQYCVELPDITQFIDLIHTLYTLFKWGILLHIFSTITSAVRFPRCTVYSSQHSHQSISYCDNNKRLTGSVEHHEDRPLVLLQQLPEVLKKRKREWGRTWRRSFIIYEQNIFALH